MYTLRKIVFLVSVVTLATVGEAQKKYTDANRPYEFGFKIDGEQHRHEKKTEDGLIMGEFGFITGDGIYHVTVFATDENGNYKILSMKHIQVGPSPWGKKNTPAPTTTTTTTTTPAPTQRPSPQLQGKPGCSSCLIPTPPPPGSPSLPGSQPGSPGSPGNLGGFPGRPGQTPGGFPGSPGQTPGSGAGKFPGSGQFPGGGAGAPGGRPGGPSGGQFPGSGFPGSGGGSQGGRPGGPSGQFPGGAGGSPGGRPGSPGFPPTGPGGAGQRPGVHEGLPPGVTVDDVMGLLYKFNYSVGFHGHNELGYKNGDKDGEYYAHFRDGLKRIVTYVANDNGFQPKVKFVRLDDKDTPRAETEKELGGLKGYEFKWFNRR